MHTIFFSNMKNTLLLALAGLLAASTAGHAQEYKSKFGGKDRKVVIDMHGGEVTIEGHNGDELVIRGNGFEEPPKRAEGLRSVYNTAEDNTKLGLSVTKAGDNTIRIVKASRKSANYTIQVPRQTAVVYNEANWSGGDLEIRDVTGDLEVNMKNSDAKLLNVAGPVVAHTISSDIVVRFASLPQVPSSISNVSGAVDVTMPANSKATLKLRSVSGEIYTDFDLNMNKQQGDLQRVGGQTVEGTVNGGGSTLSLKNVSGDIYVRKAK